MGDIELREWSQADAAWYAECTREAEVQRFTADGPDVTAAQVADAIRRRQADPDVASFLIADAHTGERYGNVAVNVVDRVGHVSYLVAREARGKGIAGRALELFVAWIRENHDVDELRLWAHSDNAPSRRVAERAGFVRDPDRDRDREVKGKTWPTVAYRLVTSSR